MITLLSPAKSLDTASRLPTRKASQPRLLDRSVELIEVMRRKSPDEVAELMDISADLAELNVERYRDFTVPFTKRNARPAVLLFDGDVYQGMDVRNRFDERDFTEAQKTVRILSGLYGLLRPLDLIQPYRLEMGTRVATDRGASLYDYWGATITEQVNADLAASPGPDVVVNLASDEYFRSVRPDEVAGRVVSSLVEVVEADADRPVHFGNDIVPLLTRQGSWTPTRPAATASSRSSPSGPVATSRPGWCSTGCAASARCAGSTAAGTGTTRSSRRRTRRPSSAVPLRPDVGHRLTRRTGLGGRRR